MLGDAFRDYPWTRWTVDARDHEQRIVALQQLALEHVGLPFGDVWVAELDGSIEAAAVWMDSRTPAPDDAWGAMAEQQRALEGERHEASVAAEAAVAPMRPAEPHLYLATVGTSSAQQRKGLGTAVLEPVLSGATVTACLETSSPSNLAFYEGLGFAVVDELVLPGGPAVWAMRRAPARG